MRKYDETFVALGFTVTTVGDGERLERFLIMIKKKKKKSAQIVSFIFIF